MTDKSKPIREWNVASHPESEFVRFERPRVPGFGTVRVVFDHVQASDDGVDSWTDNGDGDDAAPNRGETDIVLAAILRQAGIVDDLRALLDAAAAQGDGILDNAAKRILEAFGEALS